MVSQNKVRVLYMTATLITILLLMLGQGRIAKFINGDNFLKIPEAKLKGEFGRLPIHPGDQMDLPLNSFDKESIVVVTSHASSTAVPEELLSYYLKTLPVKGWWLMSERRYDNGGGKIRYCKNRISLTIDLSPGVQSGSYYYIGLVWTKYKMSADFCSK